MLVMATWKGSSKNSRERCRQIYWSVALLMRMTNLQPHESVDNLKYDSSELSCAVSMKYTTDFKDLIWGKKECKLSH